MEFVNILSYVSIFFFMAMFYLFGASSIGVCICAPFFFKEKERVSVALTSIKPCWNLQELWLLAIPVFIFFSYKRAFSSFFSTYGIVFGIIAICLILKIVLLGNFEKFKNPILMSRVLSGSCIVACCLMGLIAGAQISGVSLGETGQFTGVPFFGLFSITSVVSGIFCIMLFSTYGSTRLAQSFQDEGEMRDVVVARRAYLQMFLILLFFALTACAKVLVGVDRKMYPGTSQSGAVCVLLICAALVASSFIGKGNYIGGDKVIHRLQGFVGVVVVVIFALTTYPNLIEASLSSVGTTITIQQASAGSDVQTMCLIGILIFSLLMIIYNFVDFRYARRAQKSNE